MNRITRKRFLDRLAAGAGAAVLAPEVLLGLQGSAPASAAPVVTPTPQQLAWQEMEFNAFAHFTINTFTDREWGDGAEDPKLFNPAAFDARQWVKTCQEAGMKMIILTAKHHDGFCLWPTGTSEHSVKSSPWRGGRGDVVGEVSRACREGGLKLGLYLSPWDRHEPCYGTAAYNRFYLNQLRELLTGYGEITEIWLDGAKGKGAKAMEYDFPAYHRMMRQLQPNAVIFSDAGPDVRWIGNERGIAGETCWSMMDRSKVTIGKADGKYLNRGDPDGPHWVPGECDVSIRPGWFYHASQDDRVKSLKSLLDIYYQSVGRNGLLLLNVPPDRRGLFHETDVARLRELRSVLDETFKTNLAAGKPVQADRVRHGSPAFGPDKIVDGDPATYWTADEGDKSATLEIDLGRAATFDRVMIQEHIPLGQRVKSFRLEARETRGWRTIAEATTIGYKRLLRLPAVTTDRVRLSILDARACPAIRAFGLFKASPREV